jgi:adenosylmethionine-8-amino-7-oxononanoate aminotransferase
VAAEAVETAFKLAKYYWKLQGQPTKHKVISRAVAYHGTPQGALAITGIPAMKAMFEPLTPGGLPRAEHELLPRGRGGSARRRPRGVRHLGGEPHRGDDPLRGPETVAAVFLEPVQNSGGASRRPPATSSACARSATSTTCCSVSDEVICAFGRIGHMFRVRCIWVVPDMITCAKAMTSGYSPIGATIVSEKIYEPFATGNTSFYHGYTFGGHRSRPRWR